MSRGGAAAAARRRVHLSSELEQLDQYGSVSRVIMVF